MQLFTTLETVIDETLNNSAVTIINAVAPPLSTLGVAFLSAWVTWQAILIMQGQTSANPLYLFQDCAIKGLWIAFAGSSTLITTYVIEMVDGVKDGLSTSLSSVAGVSTNGGGLFSNIDLVVTKIAETALDFWDNVSGIANTLSAILVLVIIGIGLAFFSIQAIKGVLKYKIFLILTIALSPIFIFLGAWDKTKGWFSAWVNSLMTYTFALIMSVLLFSFVVTVIQQSLVIEADGSISLVQAFGALLICYSTGLIAQALGDFTASLFGGNSLASSVRSNIVGNAKSLARSYIGHRRHKSTIASITQGKKG